MGKHFHQTLLREFSTKQKCLYSCFCKKKIVIGKKQTFLTEDQIFFPLLAQICHLCGNPQLQNPKEKKHRYLTTTFSDETLLRLYFYQGFFYCPLCFYLRKAERDYKLSNVQNQIAKQGVVGHIGNVLAEQVWMFTD